MIILLCAWSGIGGAGWGHVVGKTKFEFLDLLALSGAILLGPIAWIIVGLAREPDIVP